MASRSLIAVLLLCTLLVSASAQVADIIGREDHAENAKGSAAEAKAKAAEGATAAQESAQSWTELAKEKLNHYTGDAQEETGKAYGAAKDTAAESVGAAQDSAKSYLDSAKEKLSEFSKYVSRSLIQSGVGFY